MMGRQLLVLGLFISVVCIACAGAPDNADSSSPSGDAKLGGGSLHIDSFKATSAGKTRNTTPKFGTDTSKNKVSSPYIADSLNKKKQ